VPRNRFQRAYRRLVSGGWISYPSPGAYKDVNRMVEAVHRAGLSRKVVWLAPICVKG